MSPEQPVSEEDINLDSAIYDSDSQSSERLPGWIKVSAIAAASAVIGGLAAAWYYRHTLSRLRQAGQNPNDPNFGISEERTHDEY
ncbi:MAG: hypothetical protein WCC73_14770 [Terracidiphilus sp.]